MNEPTAMSGTKRSSSLVSSSCDGDGSSDCGEYKLLLLKPGGSSPKADKSDQKLKNTSSPASIEASSSPEQKTNHVTVSMQGTAINGFGENDDGANIVHNEQSGQQGCHERGHLSHLDGLRGTACMVVVMSHWAMWMRATDRSLYEYWGEYTPIAIFVQGLFSVRLFFVMSGFVLSLPILRAAAKCKSSFSSSSSSSNGTDKLLWRVARMSISRFPRLAVPAIIAYLLAYLQHLTPLPYLNPNNVQAQTYHKTGRHSEFINTLGLSFWGLWNSSDAYEGRAAHISEPLYTMPLELHASFIVFHFALVTSQVQRGRTRAVLYLLTIYLLSGDLSINLAFIGGVLLAQWYHEGFIQRWQRLVSQKKARTVCLCVLFPLMQWPGRKLGDGMYAVGSHQLPFPIGEYWMSLLAFTMILVLLITKPIIAFFNTRPIQFLGRISFSVYLLHFPLIYSFCRPLTGWLYPISGDSWNNAMWMALPFYLGLVILLSWLFFHAIEKRSPQWARSFALWVLSSN
eukprot:Nk52_evm80s164 gene=Nk52_evmTU80s164